MPNVNVKLNIELPTVKMPENKAFDKTMKEIRHVADDLDDAASKQIKSLRKQAEKSGIDVDGAEDLGHKISAQIDRMSDWLMDKSPVKGKLDVSSDHIKLSGSVKIPETQRNTSDSHSSLKDDVVFTPISRHALTVHGKTAAVGFGSGFIYGVTAKAGSTATLVVGLGGLAVTGGAIGLGMHALDDEMDKARNLGAGGLGIAVGMLTGLGVRKLAGF